MGGCGFPDYPLTGSSVEAEHKQCYNEDIATDRAEKQGLLDPERLKWFRNVSLLGAATLGGAGVVFPAYENVLFAGAGVNAAQAGGAEIIRQRKQKPKQKTAPQKA